MSAGVDDFVKVVLSVAPVEAYQDGEWVFYFSSTLLLAAKNQGTPSYTPMYPNPNHGHAPLNGDPLV